MVAKDVPTLQDVAAFAGVSTATVSRCLNSPDLVKPETRAAVERAVEKLGYTPHYGARLLASNRTNTVGAVIPTMDNAIFARGLQAFQETLSREGVTTLVASSGYDPQQEATQIRTLVEHGADGLLLIGASRPASTYAYLDQRNIPYVIAWSLKTDEGKSYVGFDNRRAARQLAEHVLAHGHRAIAMIAGRTENNDRAADRVAGVRDALRSANIPMNTFTVVEASYTIVGGRAAFTEIRRRAPQATAVICGNDILAAAAIVQAKETGCPVPDCLSIVGFDNIELATLVTPALTTVDIPHREMGMAAAKRLLQMRDDSHAGIAGRDNIELPTQIVNRASLGYFNNGKNIQS